MRIRSQGGANLTKIVREVKFNKNDSYSIRIIINLSFITSKNYDLL